MNILRNKLAIAGAIIWGVLGFCVFSEAVPQLASTNVSVSPPKQTVHIISPEAHIDITTKKIIHISGEIDKDSAAAIMDEDRHIHNMPGDIVVLIHSRGGYVLFGEKILDMLLYEKKSHPGMRLVCVADKEAMSMAFNILSYCDVKLATADTQLLAHKIRMSFSPDEVLTAAKMRQEAASLEQQDERWSAQNAKAMKLSRADYEVIADKEVMWDATRLYLTGYLDGIATID